MPEYDPIPGYEKYPVLFRTKAPPPAFKGEDTPELEVAVVSLARLTHTKDGVMIMGRYKGSWRENNGWVANAGERAVVRLLLARIRELEEAVTR